MCDSVVGSVAWTLTCAALRCNASVVARRTNRSAPSRSTLTLSASRSTWASRCRKRSSSASCSASASRSTRSTHSRCTRCLRPNVRASRAIGSSPQSSFSSFPVAFSSRALEHFSMCCAFVRCASRHGCLASRGSLSYSRQHICDDIHKSCAATALVFALLQLDVGLLCTLGSMPSNANPRRHARAPCRGHEQYTRLRQDPDVSIDLGQWVQSCVVRFFHHRC